MGLDRNLLARLGGAVLLTIAGIVAIAWSGAAADARESAARTMNGMLAQYQYPVERPGWGCGDDNHTHTGPPGAQYGSTPPPGCSEYKGPGGDQYQTTRPGWGCGDDNHVHTGPPGAQYGSTPPPGCTQYHGPGDDQYQTTRPGWGCGDDNHTHTGPPGAQYGKLPPPGCSQYRGGR